MDTGVIIEVEPRKKQGTEKNYIKILKGTDLKVLLGFFSVRFRFLARFLPKFLLLMLLFRFFYVCSQLIKRIAGSTSIQVTYNSVPRSLLVFSIFLPSLCQVPSDIHPGSFLNFFLFR